MRSNAFAAILQKSLIQISNFQFQISVKLCL